MKVTNKLVTQLAFYINLQRAVIGPSATLTGRWRPDIDLRRMLTGKEVVHEVPQSQTQPTNDTKKTHQILKQFVCILKLNLSRHMRKKYLSHRLPAKICCSYLEGTKTHVCSPAKKLHLQNYKSESHKVPFFVCRLIYDSVTCITEDGNGNMVGTCL